MRIKPAMASNPNVDEMQKVPVIQITALHYIFLSFMRGYKRGALLKNYK